MRKKRWSLFYSGLCLALVFSAGSVEAQRQCEPCHRCDQDGDQIIRKTSFCERKCDPNLATEEGALDDGPSLICPAEDDGGVATTFIVEVFFDFGGATVENIGGPITGVVGKIQGNRHNMGENPNMPVDLSRLTPPSGCTPDFGGAESATFTLHTATIPPSEPDLTFISPGLGLIVVNEVSYSLRLDGGAIADPNDAAFCDDDATDGIQPTVDDWFPGTGDTTCFEGDTITWSQQSSPTGVDCNAEVQNQPWRIGVTGE